MDLTKFRTLDIVLIAGLHGSGKSQFAKTNFNNDGRLRINRKELLKLLYETTHFDEKWKESFFNEQEEIFVKHIEKRILEHLLQENKKILIDNISVTKASRKNYLLLAHQLKKSIGIIFISVPINVCISKNRSKPDPIPEYVISSLYAAIELPKNSEGFKEVLLIDENQKV
jgi:tRNA uridine 5-carbamoylmethylation protein Kti12